MPIPIDYHLKTQIVCAVNDIPYDVKHEEAIQQIDTFIDTYPNYHTIASQGLPTDERFIYDELNDQWCRFMDFKTKTLTITNNSIIIDYK